MWYHDKWTYMGTQFPPHMQVFHLVYFVVTYGNAEAA